MGKKVKSLKDKINLKQVPKHVAIIMDGNGRWAQGKGKHRIYGHEHGITPVKEVVEAAGRIGVQYLTLYAFSTENWNRPKEEVDALMRLLVTALHREMKTLMKNGIRLHTIGDTKSLPEATYDELQDAIQTTSINSKLNVLLALSYSSKWEITEAVKQISSDVLSGKLTLSGISPELISAYLATAGFPDPELLIRTSGEIRISNFLLWQLAYAEFYFTETLWPDFRKEDFYKAILEYQRRERRFGKTSAQLVFGNTEAL